MSARVLGLLLAALLTLTALPAAFGYWVAGPDRQFMGIVMNVPDTAQYYSWARESGRALLIENKLTPEVGPAVYFNLFWFLVGRLAALSGLDVAAVTQLVRPVAGAVFICAIYWFTGLVSTNRLERWTTFLVATLGGGLGWLLVLQKQATGFLEAPLDLYVTEPNTFLSVMAFPLQALAGGLLVLILGMTALAFERTSVRLAIGAGVLALALGLQHGYDLLIVYAVVGVLGLLLAVRDGTWFRIIGLGALVCGPSLPAALYLVSLTRLSPIWGGVLAQYGNAGVYTPSLPHLIVLMGVPLVIVFGSIPLAIARRRAIAGWFSNASAREILVWAWLILGFLLLYVPTDFQIKMLACWQVPVAFASTRLLLRRLAPALELRLRRRSLQQLVAFAFVALVLPVNVYLLAWRLVDLNRRDYPYFLRADEVTALRWLERNSAPADVVLSSLTIGQYVPEVSGNTAFLAHWAETLDYYTKRRQVDLFFDSGVDEQTRTALLDRYNVQFVFYGDQERALGAYDPANSVGLAQVFSANNVAIYQVTGKSASRGGHS